jgi:hypothetical protein
MGKHHPKSYDIEGHARTGTDPASAGPNVRTKGCARSGVPISFVICNALMYKVKLNEECPRTLRGKKK